MNGTQFRIYQFLLKETLGTTKCMEVSEIAKQMNIKRQTVYTHLRNLHKHKLIFRGDAGLGAKPLTQWWAEPKALYSAATELWNKGEQMKAVDLNITLNEADKRGIFTKAEMYIFIQNNVK